MKFFIAMSLLAAAAHAAALPAAEVSQNEPLIPRAISPCCYVGGDLELKKSQLDCKGDPACKV
ncbi:uncharacterized protein N7511_002618 [Penicillium nucicola]|uniref:uncharacterized protein n=1 Tax=Penicillium nucicola TaxID=1850975 RepID=UPI0025451B04|nr:uncharacterized protein N7511_002618 [Penicillium nucicola]KAJ5770567.1 hypothetical protein N7511_002618 [Penicillium nucicola]